MKSLYVIGMGPGSYEKMTLEAIKALEKSDIIVGYTVYTDLLKKYYPDKEFLFTPMKKEIERCILAFEKADEGNAVSFVCSGDAGVYGMSGLILEIAKKYPQVRLKLIAGVTAALSGAAIIGAPLIHDFAVISLSDLLTPLEKIEKRLEYAAKADFVICIYNPSSKKRSDYLARACDILLKEKSADTPCAIVRNIDRENEEYTILSLSKLRQTPTDMFCTVFIGNSQTKVIDNRLVTPRGYENKEEFLNLVENTR